MLGEGMPDVEGCYCGEHFWLELKSARRPRRPSSAVRFRTRPGQIEWAQTRIAAGGATGFLLLVTNANNSARCVYLIGGWHGPALHRGLTEATLESYSVLASVRPSQLDVIIAAANKLRHER